MVGLMTAVVGTGGGGSSGGCDGNWVVGLAAALVEMVGGDCCGWDRRWWSGSSCGGNWGWWVW